MLKQYTMCFEGRRNGSIGITENLKVTLWAENADDARLKLYDNFEHITIEGITYHGVKES